MSLFLYRWRRLLPLALGSLAMVSLVLLDSSTLIAQAKKAAPKTAKKDDDAKEEKKAEVKYVPMIPARKDKIVGSQGAAQIQKIDELIKQNWINNKVNPSE